MNKIFDYIWSVSTLFILCLWFFDRSDVSLTDIITSKEYVPLYGLTAGAVASLVSYWAFNEAVTATATTWYDRVPSPWVELDSTTPDRQKIIWKRWVCAILILLPLGANIHFWTRLNVWQAWDNCPHTPYEGEVGLWSYPEASLVTECDFWDAHRYGDYEHRKEDKHHGISYVPFVIPVICVALSITIDLFQQNHR
jgi:hypothetical protein